MTQPLLVLLPIQMTPSIWLNKEILHQSKDMLRSMTLTRFTIYQILSPHSFSNCWLVDSFIRLSQQQALHQLWLMILTLLLAMHSQEENMMQWGSTQQMQWLLPLLSTQGKTTLLRHLHHSSRQGYSEMINIHSFTENSKPSTQRVTRWSTISGCQVLQLMLPATSADWIGSILVATLPLAQLQRQIHAPLFLNPRASIPQTPDSLSISLGSSLMAPQRPASSRSLIPTDSNFDV